LPPFALIDEIGHHPQRDGFDASGDSSTTFCNVKRRNKIEKNGAITMSNSPVGMSLSGPKIKWDLTMVLVFSIAIESTWQTIRCTTLHFRADAPAIQQKPSGPASRLILEKAEKAKKASLRPDNALPEDHPGQPIIVRRQPTIS